MVGERNKTPKTNFKYLEKRLLLHSAKIRRNKDPRDTRDSPPQ